MANTYKQLGQARENSTNAVSVYSPPSATQTIIPPKHIIICNTSGADAKVRFFWDDNGTTYDRSTALAWDVTVLADNTWEVPFGIEMNNSSGNLAYRSSVANALTITISGLEKT